MTSYEALWLVATMYVLVDLYCYTTVNAERECPSDWFYYDEDNVCLRAFLENISWLKSKEFCETHNSDSYRDSQLLIIRNEDMLDYVNDYVVGKTGRAVWIGIKYSQVKQKLMWVNGSRMNFDKWARDDFVQQAECGALQAGVFMMDVCDYDGNSPLCETTPTTVANDVCGEGNGGCQQVCSRQGNESVCDCNPGYKLKSSTDCEDIDECTVNNTNGGCQQICTNGEGFWECSCNEDYVIVNITNCTKEGDNAPRPKMKSSKTGLIILMTLSPIMFLATGSLICMRDRRDSQSERKIRGIKGRASRMPEASDKNSSGSDDDDDDEDESESDEEDDEEDEDDIDAKPKEDGVTIELSPRLSTPAGEPRPAGENAQTTVNLENVETPIDPIVVTPGPARAPAKRPPPRGAKGPAGAPTSLEANAGEVEAPAEARAAPAATAPEVPKPETNNPPANP